MEPVKSYCRICGVYCGTDVTVDATGRISKVRGDKDHPHSRGYACVKGVQSADIYDGPERLLHPLKRMQNGTFERIALDQALNEIAAKVGELIEERGARSIATFRGTANSTDGVGYNMLPAWMAAIGSPSFFSTVTIDQSAKWVTLDRLGMWRGGRQEFQDSDTWMFVGINPPVSNWPGFTSVPPNPVLSLKEARARGMKIVVIDPRRTELVEFADIHLQLRPGEDPTVAAGLLRVILDEAWHDAAFCADHVDGLDRLRNAVEPFTPGYVEARAGVAAAQLVDAARAFAAVGRRGIVVTGTGPDMAARSNLAEHLYEVINVVCGRFLRAGEIAHHQLIMAGQAPLHATVAAPKRGWEQGHKSRIRETGTLFGEMMSGILADEILLPGDGQIRAMIVAGGNPANAFPDQQKTVKALSTLDLLVTIDPFMSETARLAHYVLPPLLPYERPDIAFGFPQPFAGPFAQYTAAVAAPPQGSDLVDDWQVFWSLSSRLGRQIELNGVPLDMTVQPTRDELLEILGRKALVPVEEVKKRPGGAFFEVPPQIVQPASPDADGRFAIAPDDVVEELSEVLGEWPKSQAGDFTHRLVSRRMREVMNTTYRHLPSTARRYRYNPAYLHPNDLESLALLAGDQIEIQSEHGIIPAIVAIDDTVRPGSISMTHGWGGLPGEDLPYEQAGSSTSLLISTDSNVEIINAMPRMSAIPVNIMRLQ